MASQERSNSLDWFLAVWTVVGYFIFTFWAASIAVWITKDQPVVTLIALIIIGGAIGLWALWEDIRERRWLGKTYGSDPAGYLSELFISPGTVIVFLAGIGINLEWLTSHNLENVVCEWLIAVIIIVFLHLRLYGHKTCPQPWRGLTVICGLLVATIGVNLGLQPILWGWHLFITIVGTILLLLGYLSYAND